jgi:DNA processing protein
MDDHDALLALNAVKGLGNARISKLIEHFGGPAKVFEVSRQDILQSNLLPADVVNNLIIFPVDRFLDEEKDLLRKEHIDTIDFLNPSYPSLLKQIPDAPVILYVKGKIPDGQMNLAVVGSRRSSLYGQATADMISTRLAELGVTIVSGLARGIDTAAHKGALKARGKTIAVLGCGLLDIYPPENEMLFEEIANSGAVVSEFPLKVPPLAFNFPRRNRIISGLSLGVVVVEAALKSGALITADCALEQGRDVFAVPGKIDNPGSSGVHHLIKQGAKLITSVEDILEELKEQFIIQLNKSESPNEIQEPKNNLDNLTETQQLVYNHIGLKPKHIDELLFASCVDVREISKILFDLESKRLVRQLPGQLFSKVS